MHVVPWNPVNCRLMNTLIEVAMRLEYLSSNSQWTKDAAAGKDFGATTAALEVAKQEPTGKFNIVGYFPATKQHFQHAWRAGQGHSRNERGLSPKFMPGTHESSNIFSCMLSSTDNGRSAAAL
jgi:hypothetical protein